MLLEHQNTAEPLSDRQVEDIIRETIPGTSGSHAGDRPLRGARRRNPSAPNERQGLIPSDITYRHELNNAEQENIRARKTGRYRAAASY